MKSAREFRSVYIHRDPVDMRKAIDGLASIVETSSVASLSEPYLFVFFSRRRHLIKILFFDRSGFCLWQERLEKDKFPWPKQDPNEVVVITTEQLEWLLVELKQEREKTKHYQSENSWPREQLNTLKRAQYGKKSERWESLE